MTSRTIPPMTVVYFTTRTRLRDIGLLVGSVARDLYASAAQQGLLPSGPIHWVYIGADGKPDTEFTLEIALPVFGKVMSSSRYPQKELPAFDCISTRHNGAWDHLYETYDRLMDDIYSKGSTPSGVCREQYLFMDFENPLNNITEVQVGI